MPDALSLSRSELPEEIATAIAEVVATQRAFAGMDLHPSNREAWKASLSCSGALEALTAAILSRLGEAEDIQAPEDVLEPEWGHNCFRSVLGESYKPRVWGKYRALNYAGLREVLAIEGLPDKAHDVIAALIWNRVVVGNNAHHAFEAAAKAQSERDAALARVERLEKALKPFADVCDAGHMRYVKDEQVLELSTRAEVPVSEKLRGRDFRAARTALTEAGRLAIKDA